MGQYTQKIQQLYVAYFNRPADPIGLQYWENTFAATNGSAATLAAISNAFATSAEYTEAYAGKSSAAVIDTIYQNLFGRGAETEGLLFWATALESKQLTLSNIVTTISGSARTTDKVAYDAKVTAATSFTAALDTRDEILNYAGPTALTLAKNFIAGVTSAETLATAIEAAALAASVKAVNDAGQALNSAGVTYKLTTGKDVFVGGSGNDTFLADAISGATLTSFDSLDGGKGENVLQMTAIGAVSVPATVMVSNVQTASLLGDGNVAVDASKWTGLTKLDVVAGAGSNLTAMATTNVTVNDLQQAAAVTVNGGKDVSITTSGSTSGVITATGAAGAVMVARTNSGAGAAGATNVTGGTTVDIKVTATNPVNSTQNLGAVSVVGGAATTSVSVVQSAQATASASKAGVNAAAVTITDVNSDNATTTAGKITSVTVNGYTTLSIDDNALTTLSVANGSGNIIIDNASKLATVTNKTLGLTVNALTGGTLDDADIYTTLNVTTAGANSTLANVTFGEATALTVAGAKALTLTSTNGLGKLATVTVSGTAGLTADLSGATVTSVTTSATTGTTAVTIDASKATYTGGAGVDTVVNSTTTSTKAIALGAGDDSFAMTKVGSATPTGTIDGGAGTDNISLITSVAATASGDAAFAGKVTNFESVTLTTPGSETIDLAVLGNFTSVSTSGATALVLNKMPTNGSLTLTGAGTAYTVGGDTAAQINTADVLNVKLTGAAGAAFASTGITNSHHETLTITTTDTNETPEGKLMDSVTFLGNVAKTITVSGNAGLTLNAVSTAVTSVDASGISLGGFTWTAGAAPVAVVKGSATGANMITATASTAALTYTGGSGVDTVTISNAKNNTIAIGEGSTTTESVVTVGTGNNTITAGAGNDKVNAGSGSNNVNLGNGANFFTATSGNNTYTGGTGVDNVSVGGGNNTITLGTGLDIVSITAAGANVNTYTDIKDAHTGVAISFTDLGTGTFLNGKAKFTLASTAVFQDYANAVVQAAGNASVNGAFGWFQFNGDTYLVESRHDGSGNNASFVNNTDMIVKLTGLVDLSAATLADNTLTLG